MLVYSGTKKSFDKDVIYGMITEKITEKFTPHFGRPTSSQKEAWTNSLQFMDKILEDRDIPEDCGVSIEFQIPLTSKRVDFILSGKEADDKGAAIVIELKQWESCEEVRGKDGLVETYTGHALRETTHPSYQVLSYAYLIRDYNQTVEDEDIDIRPCAYLHNYATENPLDPINAPEYQKYIKEAPMFGKHDAYELRDFIKRYIKKGDKGEILYKLDNGKIRPSKRLQDCLKKMIHGNKEFHMIDDQKVAYEDALALAEDSLKNNEKTVMIIEGGPGTGKSVLAVNLVVELTNRDHTAFYVTKNSAPRNVYKQELSGDMKKSAIDSLFQGSGQFINAKENGINCLIVDEAHRLNEKSGLLHNKGENQIKEIIHASRFSVFFLDEDQRVTLQDIGSADEIEKYAHYYNARIFRTHLESQFRCNGSDGYIAWLDDVLDIRKTANADSFDLDYDFRIFDDPNELRDAIREKNEKNNRSRLVAGYCWNWITEGKDNPSVHDIVLPEYHFEMSWNLGNTSTWAIDKDSVEEAGCIHTCQGLEFDYVGVIIGDDLRYENGEIITDYTKRAKTDKSLFGIKKMAKEKGKEYAQKVADSLIKNTYKVLMTRGLKGCYIFCTDKNLQEYFKRRISFNK